MITALQFIVFTTYLIVIWKRFEVLPSISESTYAWEQHQQGYFTAMCWGLALLNVFQEMGWWGMITSAGLFFTGVTVNFLKPKSVSMYLHNAGTITAVLGGFLGLIFLHGIWAPLAVFAPLAYFTYRSLPNFIWWIEIQAFCLILIGYTLR